MKTKFKLTRISFLLINHRDYEKAFPSKFYFCANLRHDPNNYEKTFFVVKRCQLEGEEKLFSFISFSCTDVSIFTFDIFSENKELCSTTVISVSYEKSSQTIFHLYMKQCKCCMTIFSPPPPPFRVIRHSYVYGKYFLQRGESLNYFIKRVYFPMFFSVIASAEKHFAVRTRS